MYHGGHGTLLLLGDAFQLLQFLVSDKSHNAVRARKFTCGPGPASF
jgi:hypothetical protein